MRIITPFRAFRAYRGFSIKIVQQIYSPIEEQYGLDSTLQG